MRHRIDRKVRTHAKRFGGRPERVRRRPDPIPEVFEIVVETSNDGERPIFVIQTEEDRLVARNVEPMLPEFNARPFHAAFVLAGGGTFNDATCGKLEIVQALDEVGLEIAGNGAHDSRQITACGEYLQSERAA